MFCSIYNLGIIIFIDSHNPVNSENEQFFNSIQIVDQLFHILYSNNNIIYLL